MRRPGAATSQFSALIAAQQRQRRLEGDHVGVEENDGADQKLFQCHEGAPQVVVQVSAGRARMSRITARLSAHRTARPADVGRANSSAITRMASRLGWGQRGTKLTGCLGGMGAHDPLDVAAHEVGIDGEAMASRPDGLDPQSVSRRQPTRSSYSARTRAPTDHDSSLVISTPIERITSSTVIIARSWRCSVLRSPTTPCWRGFCRSAQVARCAGVCSLLAARRSPRARPAAVRDRRWTAARMLISRTQQQPLSDQLQHVANFLVVAGSASR